MSSVKQFAGGVATARVKVTAKKKKLGVASLSIGFGRIGAARLFAQDRNGTFDDGVGEAMGVLTFATAELAADVTTPAGAPAITSYSVSGPSGGTGRLDAPCGLP